MCEKTNTTNPKSKCLNRKNTKTIETERNKYEILIHSIDVQSYNQSHIHARIHSINPVYKQINKQQQQKQLKKSMNTIYCKYLFVNVITTTTTTINQSNL